MAAKANDTDFLRQYRGVDSDGRLDIMMENGYTELPVGDFVKIPCFY